MLGGTFIVALSYMLHARMEPQFDSVRARLLVAFLAFTQPLVRGWSRYSTWLKNKHTPSRVIRTPEAGIKETDRGSTSRFEFWNEQGHGREKLLAETTYLLEDEGWNYSLDTGWNDWDVQVYGSFWWIVRLRTVTEYHGGPKCLTRAELKLRAGGAIILTSCLLLLLLAWQQFVGAGATWWALSATGAYVLFLAARGRRLKRRLADLLNAAAQRAGLSRVTSETKT
jgi:hypothetical protein